MVARINRGFVRSRGRLALRRQPDLFISHNTKDKPFARKLADAVSKVGIDPFLDSWELEGGDSLHQSLSIALEESKFVAIVISPLFIKSEWCLDELSQALAREKKARSKVVIPLLYKSAKLPPFLKDRLYLDFRTDFFSGIAKLGQIVHDLSASRISNTIMEDPPRSLREAASILKDCGWNSTSLFGRHEFDEFVAILKKYSIRHDSRSPDRISVNIDDLYASRALLENSVVMRALIETYGKPRSDLDFFMQLDVDDPNTLSVLIAEARRLGASYDDMSQIFGFSSSTIARWEQGNARPHASLYAGFARKLLNLIDKLESSADKRPLSA